MMFNRGYPWGELKKLRTLVEGLRVEIVNLKKALRRKGDYILVGKHVFFPNIETMVLNGPISIHEYRKVQGWMDEFDYIHLPNPLARYADDDIRPLESWRIILTETPNSDTMGPPYESELI